MKTLRNLLTLSIALIAFSFVNTNAAAAGNDDKQPKSIEQQVFHKIIGLPRYGVFDFISYEVNNGTVTLSGKVSSLGTKRDAEAVVKRIPGVTSVVNNIEELPPFSSDDRIRQQILRTFANKGLYMYLWENNPSVRIIVDRGHVELEGYVANRGDYNLMNILANGVFGVFSVENHLNIGEGEVK